MMKIFFFFFFILLFQIIFIFIIYNDHQLLKIIFQEEQIILFYSKIKGLILDPFFNFTFILDPNSLFWSRNQKVLIKLSPFLTLLQKNVNRFISICSFPVIYIFLLTIFIQKVKRSCT